MAKKQGIRGGEKYPPKVCENPRCGKTFTRKRDDNGRLQPGPTYLKKRFCTPECAYVDKAEAMTYVPTQRELDMIEDVTWIIGTDTPERIAERVGYHTVDYLARTLRKCHQYELMSRLQREHTEYLQAEVAA